jgi:hypothetical protein
MNSAERSAAVVMRIALISMSLALALVGNGTTVLACNPDNSQYDPNRHCNITNAWMPYANQCVSASQGSHFDGVAGNQQYPGITQAETDISRTYSPFVQAGSSVSMWSGVVDFAGGYCQMYLNGNGAAYYGPSFAQVGQYAGTNPNTGGQSYFFYETFNCGTGTYILPAVMWQYGTIGYTAHAYKNIATRGCAVGVYNWALQVDATSFTTYCDITAHMDSAQWAAETHSAGDQNPGGFSQAGGVDHRVVAHQYDAINFGTLGAAQNGTLCGGTASNCPSAYWQNLQASPPYMIMYDIACPYD